MRWTAETVITQAIIETMRSTPTGERGRRVIRDLDEAGYAIVPKPTVGMVVVLDAEGERAIEEAAASPQDPRIVGFSERPNSGANSDPDVLDLRTGFFLQDGVATPFPESTCRNWLSAMEALPLDPSTRPTGTAIDVIALMPDGTAVAMTNEEFGERARCCVPDVIVLQEGAEFTLPPGMKLEPGTNAPPVASDEAPRISIDPRAQAVMDIVESKRLVARAEAVLGSEAVDELLSWLPDVAEPPSRAA